MQTTNPLRKVSLLLAVYVAMVVAEGCTPCGSPERDFNKFKMRLVASHKDTVSGREPEKGADHFMVYRQREDTLGILLIASLGYVGVESCPKGFTYWITSMDVVSDADWDAAHPAGTSLADITIADFYSPSALGRIFKPLPKVVFDEAFHRSIDGGDSNRSIYGPKRIFMDVTFPHPPSAGRHVFTLKVSKSSGESFEKKSNPVVWN